MPDFHPEECMQHPSWLVKGGKGPCTCAISERDRYKRALERIAKLGKDASPYYLGELATDALKSDR